MPQRRLGTASAPPRHRLGTASAPANRLLKEIDHFLLQCLSAASATPRHRLGTASAPPRHQPTNYLKKFSIFSYSASAPPRHRLGTASAPPRHQPSGRELCERLRYAFFFIAPTKTKKNKHNNIISQEPNAPPNTRGCSRTKPNQTEFDRGEPKHP